MRILIICLVLVMSMAACDPPEHETDLAPTGEELGREIDRQWEEWSATMIWLILLALLLTACNDGGGGGSQAYDIALAAEAVRQMEAEVEYLREQLFD